ncbi:MAG: short-chain dehydrogenase [Betaproteobacteria bacterium RIFCSPLOWO2_12_FULL_66_14]|nr:MAG: short-chain dehydrogenase [Betaproteobacteria bacterium RIFCSPLOWO2_12_FULL_66_14]
MDLRLTGQSALVTGASKGIGLAVARAFAAEGCNLHLAARSEDALKNAKEELSRKHGVSVAIHPMDLGKSENILELGRRCADVDILVNNAGEIPSGPIEALSEEDWRRGYDLKLFGYILLTKEIYRSMKARGSGVIINDIGNSGENWDANYIAGSTANAALMAFTKALGGQSLDFGVRVVGVNPGPVETERMVKINKRRAVDWYGDESRWTEMRERFPGGRPASAEEVADLTVFLASPRCGYVTGAIVTIDGGIAARGSVIKERSAPK